MFVTGNGTITVSCEDLVFLFDSSITTTALSSFCSWLGSKTYKKKALVFLQCFVLKHFLCTTDRNFSTVNQLNNKILSEGIHFLLVNMTSSFCK